MTSLLATAGIVGLVVAVLTILKLRTSAKSAAVDEDRQLFIDATVLEFLLRKGGIDGAFAKQKAFEVYRAASSSDGAKRLEARETLQGAQIKLVMEPHLRAEYQAELEAKMRQAMDADPRA